MRIHFRDIRCRNNGGMDIPLCVARRSGPLDTDSGRLDSTGDVTLVTCLRCLDSVPKDYPWSNSAKLAPSIAARYRKSA